MHRNVLAIIVCGALLTTTSLSAEENILANDPTARQKPSTVITELDESIADQQWVTMVYTVERAEAVKFVPILRPLIPQNGHLVAHQGANTLVMSDSYANVRRIIEIVKILDAATPRQ